MTIIQLWNILRINFWIYYMRSGELFMKLERIIELQEEQLERYKALKMCCDQ